MRRFYYGDQENEGLHPGVENLGDIDAKAINTIQISDDMQLRVGRFRLYIQYTDNEEKEFRFLNILLDELTTGKS